MAVTWKKVSSSSPGDDTNTNIGNTDLTTTDTLRVLTLGSNTASFSINDNDGNTVFLQSKIIAQFGNNVGVGAMSFKTNGSDFQIGGNEAQVTNCNELSVTSKDGSAEPGPTLLLKRNQAPGGAADNDTIGKVEFQGRDDNTNNIEYGNIEVKITDVTSSTKDSEMNFDLRSDNTLTSALKLKSLAESGGSVASGLSGAALEVYGSTLTEIVQSLYQNEVVSISNLAFSGQSAETLLTGVSFANSTAVSFTASGDGKILSASQSAYVPNVTDTMTKTGWGVFINGSLQGDYYVFDNATSPTEPTHNNVQNSHHAVFAGDGISFSSGDVITLKIPPETSDGIGTQTFSNKIYNVLTTVNFRYD